MSTLNLIGIAIGLLAVLLLCLGIDDALFFSLLAGACLFGSMGEAYRENHPGAIFWLVAAAGCVTAAVRDALEQEESERP